MKKILIVPGYGDSSSTHWQGRWLEHFPNAVKVIQKDWIKPDKQAWVKALDTAIHSIKEPMILVGHSLGCSTILHWVHSNKESIHKIKGALLVAPADSQSESYRALSIKGFDPVPMDKLPFPSILVASENDPFL